MVLWRNEAFIIVCSLPLHTLSLSISLSLSLSSPVLSSLSLFLISSLLLLCWHSSEGKTLAIYRWCVWSSMLEYTTYIHRLYRRCRVPSGEYLCAFFHQQGNLITAPVLCQWKCDCITRDHAEGVKRDRINQTWPTSMNCLMIDLPGSFGALRLCINTWVCVINKGLVTAMWRSFLSGQQGKCLDLS